MTYWLNNLQNLNSDDNFFLTLNPIYEIGVPVVIIMAFEMFLTVLTNVFLLSLAGIEKVDKNENSTFKDIDGNVVETTMFQYDMEQNLFSSIGKIKVKSKTN